MKKLAALAALALLAVAAAANPAGEWRRGLTEANIAWAKAPHALLKITDAAYIHEGEIVSLVGDPRRSSSWHWVKGRQNGAALIASFRRGQPVLEKDGRTLPADALKRGIAIARGVDVTGAPTQIAPNETGLRIMVYDQANPEARAFHGVDYFPYNPAWRVTARFKPDPQRAPRIFRTSRGLDKQFFHAGDAVFTLQGKTITLPLYTDERDPAKTTTLSSFFTDRLTGHGAYRSGRYVDVESFGRFPPASVVIDFNFAYNPNCARSRFFNCPFAIDAIPLEVTAGERDPHANHH
jgi:uncharacterized protein (DUF1684 family)